MTDLLGFFKGYVVDPIVEGVTYVLNVVAEGFKTLQMAFEMTKELLTKGLNFGVIQMEKGDSNEIVEKEYIPPQVSTTIGDDSKGEIPPTNASNTTSNNAKPPMRLTNATMYRQIPLPSGGAITWGLDSSDVTGVDGKINIFDLVSIASNLGLTKENKEWDKVSSYDFNEDGVINITDLTTLSSRFGMTASDINWDARYDLTKDGVIDENDLKHLGEFFMNTKINSKWKDSLDASPDGKIDGNDLLIVGGNLSTK